MPLGPRRLAERGFNQAMEIARPVARRLAARLEPQLVERVRDTVPQTDLPHDARAANVRGAFACAGAVAGMTLAVVDDVMTTGASLEELARTLRAAARGAVVTGGVAIDARLSVPCALVALLVALGAMFGGSLVYEYGFNVETAGDHPAWHTSEVDVLPGRHDQPVTPWSQHPASETPERIAL